jgi:very-short-patch-repair endonuclease
VNVTGQAIRPGNGGAFNKAEAIAVVTELRRLVLDRGYKGTVGVVSPFRAQANLIRELALADEPLAEQLIKQEFLSDTVHKFQGDERDVMVFSPVVSKGISTGAIGFLRNNGNLFNVAITRARSMLLVVGDLSEASNCDVEYLKRFAQFTQELREKEKPSAWTEGTDLGANYPKVANPEQVSDWEKLLYRELYKNGIGTIPQYQVEKYALDLALVFDDNRRLDIEVDGERYHRAWDGELCRRDQMRNQRLYELGWDVMRFWVYEIRDDLAGCIRKVSAWRTKQAYEINNSS